MRLFRAYTLGILGVLVIRFLNLFLGLNSVKSKKMQTIGRLDQKYEFSLSRHNLYIGNILEKRMLFNKKGKRIAFFWFPTNIGNSPSREIEFLISSKDLNPFFTSF